MRGTGRTVFSGNQIDEFQVEILGLLENVGPKESLIIARLSGGPLERAGIMQGMSGSPVYIDGKLVGAVAMAFPFAKDPITAIRPIEEMVRASPSVATASPTARSSSPAERLALAFAEKDLTRLFSRSEPAMVGEGRMLDIATPINFGGFTRSALDTFSPRLRALGLEPCQSVTSGASMAATMGNPANLQPGSMISVQLMAGDYTVAADGTVTYIDGKRLYAFGHRFLDIGPTALPFARSEVITVVPNVNASFKLTTAREWMGTINQDRNTAVAGELGKLPPMVPVSVTVSRGSRPVESYQMRIVDDPLLSPLLTQMAVYSVIDETERTVGAASIRISGEIQFQNALEPVKLNNMYAGDNGTPMQVSLSAAIPLAYVMQSGFDALRLKKIAINVETYDRKKELTIDGVSLSRREVRPGEKVQLNVVLTGQNGTDVTRQVEYLVPIGAAPGPLYFTVSDANIANITDFRQVLTTSPRTAGQVISTVNNLHPNTKAYVRVWRADPAFQLEGADFPDPPASLALILAGSQSSLASITQVRNSKIAQIEVDGGDMVVSGVKTIQVEIKE